MVESREQLETNRAYWANQAGHLRRERDFLYERLRKLENRVRETIVVGDHIDTDKLYALRQMVPNHPRKTITQKRKSKSRRK